MKRQNDESNDSIPLDYKKLYFMVRNLPSEIKWGYLASIVEYWDTRCVGLFNQDENLQRICEIENLITWKKYKSIIFGSDGFFFLEKGRWHQKFTQELFNEKQN